MKAGLSMQYAVIALLVAASAIYMLRKLAPRVMARTQMRIAVALAGAQRLPMMGAWMGALGRWLKPRAISAAGNCASGCSACCGCSRAKPAPETEQIASTMQGESVLRFYPREK